MDEKQQIEVLRAIEDIRTYVRSGGEVVYIEPEPRGRKGPDRAEARFVRFSIGEPARFDRHRWQARHQRYADDDARRALLPPPTREQQAQIAILRAIAYRVSHPTAQHAFSWWQEQPRERTTRFTVDIDTADLRQPIKRIARPHD